MSHSRTGRSQKHVIVTGGAGFIGSHLVERLLAEGERVVVIDDFSTGRRSNLAAVRGHSGLRVLAQKISRCRTLSDLVRRASGIYHLAAVVGVERVLASPLTVLQANLHETEILLECAARSRVPLLMTSSSEVYGRSRKRAFAETDDLVIGSPDGARWSYAGSKLLDEFIALAYSRERGLPVTIVRLFNTVGPRQTGRYGMVLPRFVTAAKLGQPLRVFGDGRQTRCFCHVRDAVEAMVRLQRSPRARGQIFNVGSHEEISIGKLAQSVIRFLESESAIVRIPYRTAYGRGFSDLRQRRPDLRKLARTIGFVPKTRLREMIENTAAEP